MESYWLSRQGASGNFLQNLENLILNSGILWMYIDVEKLMCVGLGQLCIRTFCFIRFLKVAMAVYVDFVAKYN